MIKSVINISIKELNTLYPVLVHISIIPNLPIKKVIALNLKNFKSKVLEIQEGHEQLVEKLYLLEEGKMVLRKGVVLNPGVNPGWMEYETNEGVTIEEAMKQLEEYETKVIELEVNKVKLSEGVLLHVDGKYQKLTIDELLQTVNNELTSAQYLVLYNYFLIEE